MHRLPLQAESDAFLLDVNPLHEEERRDKASLQSTIRPGVSSLVLGGIPSGVIRKQDKRLADYFASKILREM